MREAKSFLELKFPRRIFTTRREKAHYCLSYTITVAAHIKHASAHIGDFFYADRIVDFDL